MKVGSTFKKGVVFGCGVNDLVGVVLTSTKEYKLWSSILRRSYSSVYHKNKPKYKDVSVSDSWLLFSNFYKDIKEIPNYHKSIEEDWHLDKDILVKGNRIYSKETVCFVPNEINSLFIRANKVKNKAIGVYKLGNKYTSKFQIRGKTIELGIFETEDAAFLAYKNAKEDYIKSVANKYLGEIDEKVYKALINYSVEKYD